MLNLNFCRIYTTIGKSKSFVKLQLINLHFNWYEIILLKFWNFLNFIKLLRLIFLFMNKTKPFWTKPFSFPNRTTNYFSLVSFLGFLLLDFLGSCSAYFYTVIICKYCKCILCISGTQTLRLLDSRTSDPQTLRSSDPPSLTIRLAIQFYSLK